MPRKKGGKNPETDMKAQEVLSAVINGSKTRQQVADELGIHRKTVSVRLQRALNNDQIRDMIQRSIDRNAMMLAKVDDNFDSILDSEEAADKGLKVRIGEGIYKSFGIWRSDPLMQVNHFTPIVLKVGDEQIEIDVGASSEAGPSIQEPE
jgi:hypothetical protein